MQVPQELKENIFKVIESQMTLRDFEAWLYGNELLSNQMHEDIVLEAYAFNYHLPDARYRFKNTFLSYFDEDEFMLWKVKANLSDLIHGRNDRDRILYEFYWLGYKEEYAFLEQIGCYLYQIEDVQYYARNLDDVLQSMKRNSAQLLDAIIREENANPHFKLREFHFMIPPEENPKAESKKWWNFWK